MRTTWAMCALAAGVAALTASVGTVRPATAGEMPKRPIIAEAPIAKQPLPAPDEAEPKTQNKPKAAARTRNTPTAAKAKPAKSATPPVTPAKATVGKPARAKAAPVKPLAKPPGPTQRQLGEVVAVDYPDAGELRLDGPWRDQGYPLRLWLTSYVNKTTGEHRHMVSVQVTHHDERPRNYLRGEVLSPPALPATQTSRPSLQCTRNRDNTRQCFHAENYVLDLPEDLLERARARGFTITLAADGAPSFAVPIDAATIDAQLAAAAAVTPLTVAAKKP